MCVILPMVSVIQLKQNQQGDCDMNPLERKAAGLPYVYNDQAIIDEQYAYQDELAHYNRTMPSEHEKRREMLSRIMGDVGEACTIDTPVHANWGLRHVHFGSHIYCNAMVSFVDDADIYIGDYCMIGPGTVFATAGHPVNARLRELRYVFNLPIRVGRNVWIGSGVQIMPGITIGENSVIGAGSVVTKDIPANVVAVGNPCRVLREIGEHDRIYFFRNMKLDFDPESEELP